MKKNTLTCSEVAELFDVRATSVANLARLGKIKSIKNEDGQWLLDENSVESWFDGDRSSKLRATRLKLAKIEKDTGLTADQRAMIVVENHYLNRENKMNKKKVRMGIGNSVFSFVKNWEKRFPCFTLDEIHQEYNKNVDIPSQATRTQMSSIISGLVESGLLSRVRKGCYKLLENNKEIVASAEILPEKQPEILTEEIALAPSPVADINGANVVVLIKEVLNWDISNQSKLEIINILNQEGSV